MGKLFLFSLTLPLRKYEIAYKFNKHMEELNLVTIYWLVSIGMLVGFFTHVIMGSRGMTQIGNIVGGVIGSVIIGVICILLNVVGPLVYAVLGSLAFLFLVNVFNVHPHHEDDATLV